MPNIKSSVRSVKTDAERRAKNAAVKSNIRTSSRKVLDAVKAGKKEDAQTLLTNAVSVIDKAAQKGVIHKNCAARKKAGLAIKFNAMP